VRDSLSSAMQLRVGGSTLSHSTSGINPVRIFLTLKTYARHDSLGGLSTLRLRDSFLRKVIFTAPYAPFPHPNRLLFQSGSNPHFISKSPLSVPRGLWSSHSFGGKVVAVATTRITLLKNEQLRGLSFTLWLNLLPPPFFGPRWHRPP
jgi:hypothetical protein